MSQLLVINTSEKIPETAHLLTILIQNSKNAKLLTKVDNK